ncbi:MAG: hypothetical protein IIU28_04810 [Lachnospiraceae bacterium]|nr:hypothetical protein [Lachnospiraceae bacterium]
MTSTEFVTQYGSPRGILLMLLVGFGSIALSLGLIVLVSCLMGKKYKTREEQVQFAKLEILNLSERLFELIFSATFILLFVALYFMFSYFGVNSATLQQSWEKYNGILLLAFILMSVTLNSWMDNHIIPLKYLRPGDRAAMRLIGMIYMMVIFLYIKYIYVDSNYDSIIMYFITLIIGRFIYFDASMKDFKAAMKNAFDSLPLLALALMCTGLIARFGFGSGYLLHRNGVVFNLFLGHLYLLAWIFIINRTKLLRNIIIKL